MTPKKSVRVEKLDECRKEAAKLRDQAIDVLLCPHSKLHQHLSDHRNYLNANSLAVWAAMGDGVIKDQAPLHALLEAFSAYMAGIHPFTPDAPWDETCLSLLYRKLQVSREDGDSPAARLGTDLLTVARALQALIRIGRHNSLQAFVCHYRVLADTYRAEMRHLLDRDSRDSESPVSKYVLNQCIHAYFAWKAALDARRAVLRAAASASESLEGLNNNVDAWVEMEARRLLLGLTISILEHKSALAGSKTVALSRQVFDALKRPLTVPARNQLDELLTQIAVDTECEASEGHQNIEAAIGLCRPRASDGLQWHTAAICALQKGGDTLRACEEEMKTGNSRQHRFRAVESKLEELAERLVRKMLVFRERLESVLDAQKAKQPPDVPELLSAAVSFGYLTDDWRHSGLTFAIQAAVQSTQVDGTFPPGSPIDLASARGAVRVVTAPQLIRLVSELAKKTHDGWKHVPVETIERYLRFFKQTQLRAHHDQQTCTIDKHKKFGWCHESDRSDRSEVWIIASVALALGALVDFIDHAINEAVLSRFQVRRPSAEGKALCLERTIYPDYGLAYANRRESIAFEMQQARAHINGIAGCRDRSFSFILHGPPGTGKTTFAEALAQTCRVPLLEVTPSDLLQWGAEETEARTRYVFSLLAKLTRVVIIFDECDPILRMRPKKARPPTSVYEFLTPGLLPKLKALHGAAKENGVAYFLATNHVSQLDSAATRDGRFDNRIGIFSPDVLSRLGEFIRNYCQSLQRNRIPPSHEAALVDAVASYASAQMEHLVPRLVNKELAQAIELGKIELTPSEPPDWLPGDGQETDQFNLVQEWDRMFMDIAREHRTVAEASIELLSGAMRTPSPRRP